MLELGRELFELLNAKQHVRAPVVYGAPGLSTLEIKAIEDQLSIGLPEDFTYLFQHLQDPGGVFFPWAKFKKEAYDAAIGWVLQGIEFDIEHNHFWLERWGRRRSSLAESLDVARRDFSTWPKLLPIFGHRFLAAEPRRRGNPVFSIKQTDIIYYGADLAHYLVHEFVDHDHTLHTHAQKIQPIPIWSDLVR